MHSVVRLSRDVVEAIRDTARENDTNLLLLRYTAPPERRGRLFGSVIDPLLVDAPCDVAVASLSGNKKIRHILVPVSFGPTCRQIVSFARGIAAVCPPDCRVTLLHIVPTKAEAKLEFEEKFASLIEEPDGPPVDYRVVAGRSVSASILAEAKGCQLLVLGATAQPLFKRLLLGDVPKRVLRQSNITTIVLKPAHSGISRVARHGLPALFNRCLTRFQSGT
jgi:chloride channel protein, CIC family